MAFARRRMNLTILADGTVMAIGGTGSGDSEAAAVLDGRDLGPGDRALDDGRADDARPGCTTRPRSCSPTAGRRRRRRGGGRLRAQIYSPPYLFKGARPTITGSPGLGSLRDDASDHEPRCRVDHVGRPAAALGVDPRLRHEPALRPAELHPVGNTLNAIGPASGGIAPPGDYMLIIKNSAGVPSVASWVRIGTTGGLQPGTVAGRVTDSVSDARSRA